MDQDLAKKVAAEKAASLIKDGMTVGIGTGSTVYYFIEKLIERCKSGLKISAAFSSLSSKELALRGGIKWIENDLFTKLDITVDGADEIDDEKIMIKGGGGALLREKMLASSSEEMIVIVDESKVKKHIGSAPLPIEISPFAYTSVIYKLEHLNLHGSLRHKNNKLYITDNGNYIYDIKLTSPIFNPEKLDLDLRSIPGIFETGLFIAMAGRVLIGHKDGSVTERI
jgi:ribose 5-phosphate isomerase A